MKVIFGIAILTAKDIDAMNTRISGLENAAKMNEQKVPNRARTLADFPASSIRLWTLSVGTSR